MDDTTSFGEPTERAFGTNQGKKWSNGGEKGD